MLSVVFQKEKPEKLLHHLFPSWMYELLCKKHNNKINKKHNSNSFNYSVKKHNNKI